MKTNKYLVISSIALLGSVSLAGCTTTPTQTSTTVTTGSSATTSSSGSAQDVVLPVSANPIMNSLTNSDLQIVAAGVEDLVDPITKKDMNDRLMLTLQNTGSKTLSNFEVYYEMTDAVTGITEAYYEKLTGFSLTPGAQDYVYFDNKTDAGHYPENQFSLYRSSVNQVDFKIMVSSDGAKIAEATAIKSKGTGEKAD
jgi:hypothetical protein